ncbi:MAG: N-acetylglutaminylglutamine amidotransferase [Gammaproteobacteria bacterium]|nr:N-acetylglutaminylglutamine amidotransferase [Gammaproteobacteria bacterium]
MCGIAGEVRFDAKSASADRVARMTRAMTARGPDGNGIVARGRVAFGHRRLKIIDLTERGRQPMEDPGLGLTVVFNGCIYNHAVLREELERAGYRFFSSSDTEVILKAYHAYGSACVERFNGMFAFAVHERDSGRVFLARDRLGIKPLYYTRTPGALRFASSLPALIHVSRRRPELDAVALHHYLSFHSVVPAPRTLFAGYHKLPPATTVTFEPDGSFREQYYWAPDYEAVLEGVDTQDPAAVTDALLGQLRAAVQRRLVADVPVGVLLSGGVDSSLLVALLARGGVRDLQTFSIGFEAAGGERGDEFQYSDMVAREYATRHHKIEVDSATLIEHLPACVKAMNEPMVSHDNIGFYLLGKYVSEHVKVVQSGQGADEVFGGYHWYPPLLGSNAPLDAYAGAFFDRDHAEYTEVVDARFAIDHDASRDLVARHFDQPGARDAVDRALRLDTTVMLVDDPVKRVDNMTMAWGLEARVPFLDHELVEFAAAIPAHMKVRDGGKYILKQAARTMLPAAVIDRPKGYFPVPALKYLNGKGLGFVRDMLASEISVKRGLFNRAYVDTLLDAPADHITPLGGSKLWQIATLEFWLQTHGL